MATISVSCDDSVYVLVSASNGLLQNISPSPLRVVFSATLPAVDFDGFIILERNGRLEKTAVAGPEGSIYVRSQKGRSNLVSFSVHT